MFSVSLRRSLCGPVLVLSGLYVVSVRLQLVSVWSSVSLWVVSTWSSALDR